MTAGNTGALLRGLPTVIGVLLAVLVADPLLGQSVEGDTRELLRLHEELLAAHREGDIDRWMAVESANYVSANSGRITYPTVEARRSGRADYLDRATFEIYEDVTPPVVRVSADGTLGWVIAEVEVRGVLDGASGATEAFHDIWAWIELYEKVDGTWIMTGNASNRRPGEGE